ncbi:MAG: hypothetical protein LBL45_08185 [Treponema sp.]|nr:hypothetical protein [Treponema sp.]
MSTAYKDRSLRLFLNADVVPKADYDSSSTGGSIPSSVPPRYSPESRRDQERDHDAIKESFFRQSWRFAKRNSTLTRADQPL